MAYQLIHNPYDTEGIDKTYSPRQNLRSNDFHKLISAPRIVNLLVTDGQKSTR